MARGLLVSYAGYPYTPSSLTPDNGLANLAGALLEAGHDVRIVDYGTLATMRRLFPEELSSQVKPLAEKMLASSDEAPTPEQLGQIGQLADWLDAYQQAQLQQIGQELIEEVSEFQPDFVGFKLWNGDGFSGSVAVARMLRDEFPDLHIYAGGPQASWFNKVIYQRTDVFEAIACGEAEATIVALAEHATGERKLGDIPAIVYRQNGEVMEAPRTGWLDLNDLPVPVYDPEIYPAMAGNEKIKIVVLDDSRGCPYRCGFCTHPMESGSRLRTASAQLLVDRMEQVIRDYGISVFRFAGSSTPGSLMYEVAQQILARGLDVQYSCFGHFASADPDHFQVMADSGLYAIFFGLESGCQQVLDKAVRKGINMAMVKETVQKAQQAGLFVVTSMIVPLPFDTEATIRESLDFVTDLRPDSVPVQFPGLLPGTPWLEQPEKYNFEVDTEELLLTGLDYKIKLLFPPQFWEAPPYKVNGMSFPEFAALTMKFAEDLEKTGILTAVPDDMALIAKCAGMTAREFRDQARLWCLTGDVAGMAQMAEQANRVITSGQPGVA